MKARVLATVAILLGSVSLPVVTGAGNANSSTNSGVTSSNNGFHGGGSHVVEGSHPTGVSSGPAIHPGASGNVARGIRPAPALGDLRPYPAAARPGQHPTTIRGNIRPGLSARSLPPRSHLPQLNFAGQRSQTPPARYTPVHPQARTTYNAVFTTRDGRPHEGNWSRHDPANKNRFDHNTQDRLRTWHGPRPDFTEACRRHNDHHHHHHPRDWWRNHCDAVVLVDWGFWGWSNGWWYPAWGYDAYYSSYEYDGPIYGYDGLLPDEIVANVQSELQRLGYYPYEVDGILGRLTEEALANYQADNGLPITRAIDAQTLQALGLI